MSVPFSMTTPSDADIWGSIAKAAIEKLWNLARMGDNRALEQLYEVTRFASTHLEHSPPGILNAVAKNKQHWPVLMCRSKGFAENVIKKLEALELGDDVSDPVRYDLLLNKTKAKDTLVALLQVIQSIELCFLMKWIENQQTVESRDRYPEEAEELNLWNERINDHYRSLEREDPATHDEFLRRLIFRNMERVLGGIKTVSPADFPLALKRLVLHLHGFEIADPCRTKNPQGGGGSSNRMKQRESPPYFQCAMELLKHLTNGAYEKKKFGLWRLGEKRAQRHCDDTGTWLRNGIREALRDAFDALAGTKGASKAK